MLYMKKVLSILLLVLLPGALCAAGSKTNGRIAIVDDAIAPAGSVNMTGGGIYSAQGYIGPVDSGQRSNAPSFIEAGFYSRFVSSPTLFDYSSASSDSINALWSAVNPDGTLYQAFTSTGTIGDYFQLLGTTDYQQLIGALGPNTTYYHYLMANYMEGDYAPYVSTAALTLSAVPSDGAFVFRDIGAGPVEFSFPSANPGPAGISSWASAAPNLPGNNYGLATAVYGNYMYISGGNDGVKFSSAVYSAKLNPDGTLNSWTNAGYLPASRYGHQMFAAKGRLYVLGGFNAGSAQSTVWSAAVSPQGALGAWTAETSLPVKLYFHAAAYYNGYIYVSGGYSASVSAAVYSAPLGDDGVIGSSWTATTALKNARYGHTMNELNGALYVVGGNDGAAPKSTVWSAPISGGGTVGAWADQASLPSVRFAHRAGVMGDKLAVLGGNNGTGPQNMVWVASVPAGGGIYSWSALPPLPDLSQFHAAETVGGNIYVLGGYGAAGARSTLYVSTAMGTQYLAQASTDSFASLSEESSWTSDTKWKFRTLASGTTYYFRVKARNWALAETGFSAAASTVTYAVVPGTAPWSGVHISTGLAAWLAGDNAPGTLYQCDVSSSAAYSPVALSTLTANLYAYFEGLQSGTTYYARVKAFNSAGVPTRFAYLLSAWTSLDPALDTSSPTITDTQEGDDIWRNANTSVYNIAFADTGGGQLSGFQVLAATGTAQTGPITGWVDVSTALAGTSYSEDWSLPQSVWDAMQEGVTAYISVRVYDTVLNSSETADAFYVLKDTTLPSVSINYTAPADWVSEYPGAVSPATFTDATSKLARAQYSVSTNKLSADANVTGWTDIGDPAGGAVYSSGWNYDFAQLANGASNYFSLKGTDAAGNESVLYDAFAIKKSMLGPVVTLTSPSGLYLSTVTLIAGSAVETSSHAVIGTEISVYDDGSARYWDGAGFTAPTRVWHVASGTDTFSLAVSLPLVSGRLYEIVARSSDTVGYSSAYSTVTFTYDTEAPSAAVTSPADGSSAYSPVSLGGTAADAVAGVDVVQIALRGAADGKYWNGFSAWVAAETALEAGNSASWTYNFSDVLADSLANGGTYYCSARAADKASPANSSAFGVSGSTFVYYDIVPPGAPRSLSAAVGSLPGTAVLSWVSPGDNGAGGYLVLNSAFLVQASTWPGAQFSTATAGNVSVSTSGIAAGSAQSYTISRLAAGSTYYFAMWAADDAMNWSAVSSTASSVTGAPNTGSIAGAVTQASSEPINGIIVEALDDSEFVRGSDTSDTDGTYELSGLDLGNYTIRATWSANDITSVVSKSGIAAGAAGIHFRLSVAYELAEISGYVPAGFVPVMPRSARVRPSGRFRPSGAEGEGPFVELFQKGRRVAAAPVDAGGRFRISNLLPGSYSVRVFNGREFTDMTPVKLLEGQTYNFVPEWTILSKDAVYAYPNPARTSVNIHFETNLASQSDFNVEIAVFDIAGRLMKTFRDGDVAAVGGGSYNATWNFSNEKVASGVYLYVVRLKYISTGKVEKAVKKLAIIR